MSELTQLGRKYRTDKVDVWHTFKGENYMDIYAKYMKRFRFREFTFLEIGVRDGASLRTWAEYFPHATVVGIDINPDCKAHEQVRIKIEIGSQDDPEFLQQVIAKHGPFGIVVDDGSHINTMMIESFIHLNPHTLGLYIFEDMKASHVDLTEDVKSWPGMKLNKDLNPDNSSTRREFESGFLHIIKNLDYKVGDWKAVHFHQQIIVLER